jgi:type IV pilus assembly protein PilN
MIKINLLPYRTSKKKETATQQFIMMGIILVVALVVMGGVYSVTLSKIHTTQDEISRLEDELKNLKKKIGEIDNLKKLQAEVQKKLDILAQLRKEKTGPATRLARLSDIVSERMWLTKYAETGTSVSISGLAYNEELIADFMRKIQSSPEFVNVELQVSEQQEMGGVKLKRFDITCALNVVKKEEPSKDASKPAAK